MKTYTQNMTVRLTVTAETAEDADNLRRRAMDLIENPFCEWARDLLAAGGARMRVIGYDPFRDCHASPLYEPADERPMNPEPEDITS